MDLSALLAAAGVPAQYVGYASAAIGIATIVVRAAPKPSQNGTYKLIYDLFSRLAHLTLQPSDIHTVPVTLIKGP